MHKKVMEKGIARGYHSWAETGSFLLSSQIDFKVHVCYPDKPVAKDFLNLPD